MGAAAAMSKDIVVRLVTPGGRSRLVMGATATFAEFQAEVKAKTGVEEAAQLFALDQKGQQPVKGNSSALLSSLGVANGTQIYLINQEASIAAQVLTKVPVPVEPEKPVTKSGSGTGGAAASGAASSSAPAPAAAPPATYGTPGDDKLQANPKFETFDKFLKMRRYDTTALPGNQTFLSSTVSQSGMIKIPPAVSIKQQPYRHVDTLSVMNVPEVEYFIGYWQSHLMENAMQRVGWMYGYYLEDTNFGEGTRAVLEGIYEPPQEMVGEIAQFKDDPNHGRVDKLAEALGLERIGWVFTSWPLDDDQLLSPVEVQRIARLQNENSTDVHFTNYRLSKFVTCAIRPDPAQGGAPGINPFMVSDQACAMQRCDILGTTPIGSTS